MTATTETTDDSATTTLPPVPALPGDGEPVPYFPLEHLRSSGLIAYINARCLHPLGLALAVDVADDGETTGIAGIFDLRGDPEGFVFNDWPENASALFAAWDELAESKAEGRAELLGGDPVQVPPA